MPNLIGHISGAPGRIARSARRARAKLGRAQTGFDPEFLRRATRVALWGIGLLVVVADAAAFAGSYLGLFQWATNHGMAGWRAYAFPLMVDTFVAVGELALFVSAARLWSFRTRLGGWTVALIGLAASVAGNVYHAPTADIPTRLTWAVPPLAAAAALAVGLGILKSVARERRERRDVVAEAEDATREALATDRRAAANGRAEFERFSVTQPAMRITVAEGGAGRPATATRIRVTGDSSEAHRARIWIAEERLAGREPGIREVAARWLGGDSAGPPYEGGNKRLAKRLLDERPS